MNPIVSIVYKILLILELLRIRTTEVHIKWSALYTEKLTLNLLAARSRVCSIDAVVFTDFTSSSRDAA